jgi:anti-sigma regulatory factor (Ser/Thr protein kinase)
MCAQGMRARLCKVLQYLPEEDCLLVRAGAGWKPGFVGSARLGADLASPAGFTFRTGTPVFSNHLENEQRFRTPPLLVAHRVRRAIYVPIPIGGERHRDVLEVDSPDEGKFDRADTEFMKGFANLLGVVIERERAEVHEIELASFLSDFCAMLRDTTPRLVTVCEIRALRVPMDQTVRIGLCANELMTNAYKYTCSEGEEGEVRASGARTSEDRYCLCVSDNGRGLPAGFDPAKSGGSLGMRIVTALARQLGAELTASDNRRGARFTLSLPTRQTLSSA